MTAKRIFLSPPHMSGNELEYIRDVFESNYIAPLGEYVDKFEESVKKYTDAKYALALSSGTAAMHLAVKVLQIDEEDEVFASTLNFIGSVAPVKYERASLTFVDSDLRSWNMDPDLLEEEFSKRAALSKKLPKAVILTHLYGQCAKVDVIKDICDHYNVYLIEDAAESLGAFYKGRHTGTFGDFGVLSFNGNKILTTSGGGMLISNNKEFIDKARYYSTQAKENKPYYEHVEIGYNYRMSNVLAAIGVAQMEVLEERVGKKRRIFDIYREELGEIAEFMPELSDCRGNRWLTTALSDTDPEKIIKALEDENIEARMVWKPMHMQPVFKNCKVLRGKVSEKLFKKGICLPSGTALEREDVVKIAKIVKQVVD